MGMYLSLANVSDATIERLLADPPLVWQIIEPDDPNAVAAAREPPPGPGFIGRLLGRKAPPRRRWHPAKGGRTGGRPGAWTADRAHLSPGRVVR